MKQLEEDMIYLIGEINRIVINNKNEIPDGVYKIVLDLLYHQKNTVKEMMIEYEQSLNETRDNSMCKL